MEGILIALVIGAIAGWGAGKLMNGGGFGLLWDIIIGIVGGVLGGWVCKLLNLNFAGDLVSQTLVGLGGACLLLFIIRLVKKR